MVPESLHLGRELAPPHEWRDPSQIEDRVSCFGERMEPTKSCYYCMIYPDTLRLVLVANIRPPNFESMILLFSPIGEMY